LELVALLKDPDISNLFSARLRKVRVNVAFSNMRQCTAQLAIDRTAKHNAPHKIGMEYPSRLTGALLKFGIFFRRLTFSLNGLLARRSAKNSVSSWSEHHCQLHLTGQVP
jgi:hypothetical protein